MDGHHNHHHRRPGWDNSAQENHDAGYSAEPGRGSSRREGGSSRYERERESYSRASKRRHVEESERRDSRRHDSWEHDKYEGNEQRHRSRDAGDDESSWHHDYDSDRERKRERRAKDKDGKGGRSKDRSSDRERWHEKSNSYGSDDAAHGSRSPYGGWEEDKQDIYEKPLQDCYPQQQESFPVVPSGTVVVKGLSQKTIEDDLYRALEGWGPLKHVRVIKEKTSGASRGFAFIDFPSVEGAERLMQAIGNEGLIVNGRRLFFEYSSRPTGGGAYSDYRWSGSGTKCIPAVATDWICGICGYLNFARRIVCLQCNEARGEEPDVSGFRGAEPAPSHVLAVRGLDENIDEEILHCEFSKYAPIKDLRLIRDKFTHVSRGYAFIHFHSVEDATRALESSNGVAIDKYGQILRVAFAKSPYGLHGGPSSTIRSVTASASAAEAAASVQQYDAAGWEPKEYESTLQAEEAAQASGFVWDESSGYYYDAVTKFYFDPQRNLYYDSTNGIWYTFNQEQQQYELYYDPTTTAVDSQTPGSEAKEEVKDKPRKVSANAVISAPAVVHNDVKEKTPEAQVRNDTKPKEARVAVKNPASSKKKIANAFNLWKQRQNEDVDKAVSDEDVGKTRQTGALKARLSDGEAASTSFKADTPAHVQRAKRRFTETGQTVYRDRAAERRSLYGLTVPGFEDTEEPPSSRAMPYPPGVGGRSSGSFEVTTSDRAIDENNIGNRMLRNMGWQEGSGLGREGNGIVEPVQPQVSNQRAGLGSQRKLDGRFEAQPGDSYRAIIQKKSFARFHDML